MMHMPQAGFSLSSATMGLTDLVASYDFSTEDHVEL